MNKNNQVVRTEDRYESYLPDAALVQLEDDILGWGKFADRIAHALKSNKSQRGFVVGIQGKWGSGKSTLLNFLKTKLNDGTGKIRTLTYNPWLFPDTNHTGFFFKELAKVVQFEGKNKKRRKLAKLLIKYGTYIDATKVISQAIAELGARLILVLTVSLGASSLIFEWHPVLKIVLGILALASIVANASSKIIAAIASTLVLRYKEKKTLSKLKSELKKFLEDKNNKIEEHFIVLIDDIDRLPPHQICEIFQIVKNNGDLPNISYVLAYDKEVVQEVLAREYVEQYRSFPDKIVQIEFSVPYPDKVKLNEYFLGELYGLLKEILPKSMHEEFDQVRLQNYYYIYLQHFFSNIREAKRILNAIRFNLHNVVNSSSSEVNPIDFIVIELLRIRIPQLHEFIRTNKSVFVKVSNPTEILGPLPDTNTYLKKLYDERLASLRGYQGFAKLNELLEDLFPRLKRLGTDQEADFVDQQAKSLLRICWSEVFDRYFLYDNFKGDIPSSLISKVVSSLGRDDVIEDLLKPYYGTFAVREIMVRVLDCALQDESKRRQQIDLLVLIFNLSDHMTNTLATWFEGDNARQFIIRYLNQFITELRPEHRLNVIKSALSRSNSIAGPLFLTTSELYKSKQEPAAITLIDSKNLPWLMSTACKRVVEWLESCMCLDHPLFKDVMSDDKKICEQESFKTALVVLLKKNELNYKKFLARYVVNKGPIGYGMFASEPKYEFDFDAVDKIIDVDELIEIRKGIHWLEGEPEGYKVAWSLFHDGIHDFRRKKKEDQGASNS